MTLSTQIQQTTAAAPTTRTDRDAQPATARYAPPLRFRSGRINVEHSRRARTPYWIGELGSAR